MATNFEKRKAKAKAETAVEATAPSAVEVQLEAETVTLQQGDVAGEVLTNTGYDIFLDPADNRTYQIVTIKYDPVSKHALVTEVKPISRNIGLSHDYQKRALEALKSR